MPDLNIENYYVCEQAVSFYCKIGDYQVSYDNGWSCGCTGFKFRKTCKHVKEAQEKRCTWNQYIDGGEPVKVERSEDFTFGLACPKCGEPISVIRVGV